MITKRTDAWVAVASLVLAAAAATGGTHAALANTYLPNVVVQTQDGARVRFYEDLIKDKVVLINFMFTSCTNQCPRTTANLVKVAEQFGDRLGRDVRMISITLDPATDTPAVLSDYSRRYGTKSGWYFVTGRQKDIDVIRHRLGMREDTTDLMQHTGMLIYGNDAAGQWAATPALAQPKAIVRSVMPLIPRPADR